MIGIEWDVPASLTTVMGTMTFNTFPGLVLDPHSCTATKDVRAPKDVVPQGDGDIIHHRFLTGYVYKLVARALESADAIACAEDARLMIEELGLHLTAMLNDAGRYCWTPSNYGDNRALDEARWFTGVVQSLSEGGAYTVEFEIDSPFPYAIDLTQQTITATPGVGQPITNAGNANFYPVMQVQGPATSWSIANTTTGDGIVYGYAQPNARPLAVGEYAEIDTYRGTIFLNGDQDDLSGGINPVTTDLENPFLLIPGLNNIVVIDADVVFLVNNAWS